MKQISKGIVPWGKVRRIKRNGIDLPANGAEGLFGTYRVAWSDMGENNISYVTGGDSWVGIIEFGEIVKGKVLLSYGNSSQQGSQHNGDQLKLFSEKKLRDALFYKEMIDGNRQRREALINKKFVETSQ